MITWRTGWTPCFVNAVHNKLEQDRIETLSNSKSNMRPKRKRRRLTRRKLSYTRWRTASTLHEWKMTDLFRHPTHPFDVDKVSRVQTDMTKADFPLHMSTYSCDLCGNYFIVVWRHVPSLWFQTRYSVVWWMCEEWHCRLGILSQYRSGGGNRRVKVTPHQPHSHTNNF